MPPFITGFKTLLNAASGWLLYLVPVAIALIVVIYGMKMYQANDPADKKEAKDKGFRVVCITAIIGSATWISNYLWGLFS